MTADYERWQQLDFVVGIRIELSNNHTLNGKKFRDICDKLSAPLGSTNTEGKGCYPKDFKFSGWHPLCRCHVITILKTDEEIAEDTRRILDGEPIDGKSVNRVDDVPGDFKKWLKDNEERAKRSTSVPYFIKDNERYLPKGYKDMYGMKTPYATYAEYEAAMAYNKKHANFSDAIKRNNRELSALLPVMQGKIMNFTEADGSRCNPKFSIENARELGYYDNCQTCTMTYELRRRGFNVEAKPSPLVKNVMREFDLFAASKGANWTLRFLNSDGTPVRYKYSGYDIHKDTIAAKNAYIQNETMQQGRYEVYCAWKGKNAGAHVFIVERQKNGELLWFDPQSGRRGGAFKDYLQRMSKLKISILRIDDKLINPLFAERLIKAI